MAIRSALDTLIELAQRECDDAGKRLGAALAAAEETEAKLAMLLNYREDYAMKLDAAQVAGITPLAYRNFVAFIGKLDNAINGQREVVKHAHHKFDIDHPGKDTFRHRQVERFGDLERLARARDEDDLVPFEHRMPRERPLRRPGVAVGLAGGRPEGLRPLSGTGAAAGCGGRDG